MHELSSTRPLLCGEMVDRVRELHELHEVLERAAKGRPQLVLLAGEAGLGKTKLCRAFMQSSLGRQAQVLFGLAIPQDRALPFGPFLDALRRYFTTGASTLPEAHASLHAPLVSILRLFPELASMFPGSISSSLEGDAEAVQSQQAVFHGMLNALQELARSSPGPLLLVLEDLHWADETSLELLAFLAERLDVNATSATSTPQDQQAGLLILGTYRADALPDNPALSRLLLQLRAQRHAHDIHLAPLSSSEHRRCVNSILGQPVPEEFAGFLFAWDEGNPFFTEELLGSMAAVGQLQMQPQGWLVAAGMRPHLPSSLTDAILERFARLPAADQEVLSYAAVIGRVFDFPLLAALSGLDEHELVRILRRAKSLQLISEVDHTQSFTSANREQERYQFRHALTREAIYDQMLTSERRLRHLTVAETLEKLGTNGPLASQALSSRRLDDVSRLLAEHYWLAGAPDKARPYALHEAERASRVFAFREERHYLDMAQASLPEDSPERLDLLQRMGMLSLGAFDFADALYWLDMAKAGYQRIGQPYQALQVMANMLLPSWFLARSSFPDMLAEVETAAEAVFAQPDHTDRGVDTLFITSLIAMYQTDEGQFHRALRWIERGGAFYDSLSDPRKGATIQLSLLSRGLIKANQHATIAEEGIAEVRSVLKTALEYSLPDVILFSYAWLPWILLYWGRSDEAEQVLAEATDFEARSGALRPSFLIGWQRFFSGERWQEGIDLLCGEVKRMEQANIPALAAIEGVILVHLLLARDELDEAQSYLQSIQPTLETLDLYLFFAQMWWGFAKLAAARGDLRRAHECFERILKRWKTTEDTLQILPMLLDGIIFYAESGELAQAGQWLSELRAVMQVTDNPVGAAALLEAQGVVYSREGKIEPSIQELRQAVEAWGKLKRLYQQALACQRLAEVLLTWARQQSSNRAVVQAAREEADLLLDKALAVYEDLQVPTGVEAVQALRSGTHLESQRKRRQTMETRRPLEGLTERESQVLLQLAAGRTNKEIASALHISVGTVEVHVTHVLTKLGCETRTQAAAYAVARGKNFSSAATIVLSTSICFTQGCGGISSLRAKMILDEGEWPSEQKRQAS